MWRAAQGAAGDRVGAGAARLRGHRGHAAGGRAVRRGGAGGGQGGEGEEEVASAHVVIPRREDLARFARQPSGRETNLDASPLLASRAGVA